MGEGRGNGLTEIKKVRVTCLVLIIMNECSTLLYSTMKYSKGHSNDRAGNKMFMHGHKDGRFVLSITIKPCGRAIRRKIITQRDEPNFHVIFLLPNQNQERKMKCDLTSFSTVLQSYQDDGRVIRKRSVKDLRSNPGPLDQ